MLNLRKFSQVDLLPAIEQYIEIAQEDMPTFEDLRDLYEFEYKLSKSVNPQYRKWYVQQLQTKLEHIRKGLLSAYADWIYVNWLADYPATVEGFAEAVQTTSSGLLPGVVKIFERLLNEFSATSLQQQIVLVQEALTFTHRNGIMATHVFQSSPLFTQYEEQYDPDEASVFLTDLSEGKFIPEWEKELRKEERIKLNLRK